MAVATSAQPVCSSTLVCHVPQQVLNKVPRKLQRRFLAVLLHMNHKQAVELNSLLKFKTKGLGVVRRGPATLSPLPLPWQRSLSCLFWHTGLLLNYAHACTVWTAHSCRQVRGQAQLCFGVSPVVLTTLSS